MEAQAMIELGAGIFMLGQSVIMTEPICQSYAEIVDELETKYHETVIVEEPGPQDSVVQHWTNSQTGTYIVVLKKSDAVGCIMEFGMRKNTY